MEVGEVPDWGGARSGRCQIGEAGLAQGILNLCKRCILLCGGHLLERAIQRKGKFHEKETKFDDCYDRSAAV